MKKKFIGLMLLVCLMVMASTAMPVIPVYADSPFCLLMTAENIRGSSTEPLRSGVVAGNDYQIYHNATGNEAGSFDSTGTIGLLRANGLAAASPAIIPFYVPDDGQYRIFVHCKEFSGATSARISKITIDNTTYTGCYYGTKATNPIMDNNPETQNPMPEGMGASGFYWDGGEAHHSPVTLTKGKHTLTMKAFTNSSVTRVDAVLIMKQSDSASFPAYNTPAVDFVQYVDVSAPVFSGSITATNVTDSSMTLNWSVADSGSGVAEVEIYRNDALIGTVDGAVTSFSDTGLSEGTAYTYKIRAIDRLSQYAEVTGNFSTISPVITATKMTFDQSDLLSDTDIVCTTIVSSTSSKNKDVYLIAALIKGDVPTLQVVDIKKVTVSANAVAEPHSITAKFTDTAGCKLKTFVWSDMEKMIPLAPYAELQ